MNMYAPSLEEFQQLATQGTLIPVTRRLLADVETPVSAYRKIRGQGESFLFESVEGGEHLGRYSFVGCNPRAIIRQIGNRVHVSEGGKVREKFLVSRTPVEGEQTVRDGLEVVEKVLKNFRAVAVPGLPRFTGGAVGFIGYEFIHDLEPVVPRPPLDELKTPTMEVGHRIDEAGDAQAARQPIQIAPQCCAQMGDQVEATKPRRLLPLFDVEFSAELADETAFAIPLR